MIRLNLDRLRELVPTAREPYVRALPTLETAMACFGVLRSANRARQFLATVLHESGGFRVLEENLNYTTPARLMEVWPTRFGTEESTRPYLRNPEALANKVYSGRMGNNDPGDGWKFRGRGPIQVTGQSAYVLVGRALDLDLVARPDLVVEPTYLFPVAAAVWRQHGANHLADAGDFRATTKAINGGYVGLVDRRRWLERVEPVVEEWLVVYG